MKLTYFEANEIMRYAREHGGATWDGKRLLTPKRDTGFVVGIMPWNEMRYSTPRRSGADNHASVLMLQALASLIPDGELLGVWIDGGAVVLDTVRIIDNRDAALALARQGGQRAIYNLAQGATIEVEA